MPVVARAYNCAKLKSRHCCGCVSIYTCIVFQLHMTYPLLCSWYKRVQLTGHGDLLAIFRCLSCKYSFSADLSKQDAMGAPGRVFVSGEVFSEPFQGCCKKSFSACSAKTHCSACRIAQRECHKHLRVFAVLHGSTLYKQSNINAAKPSKLPPNTALFSMPANRTT